MAPPPPMGSYGAPSYPPPSAMYSGPPLANYGQRLGGWLIDWLLLLVITLPLSAVTHSFRYTHLVNASGSSYVHFDWGFPGALLSPLVIVLYGTLLCGSRRGQTLGMMVAGTRAVKVGSGAPIGYGAALGRALFEEFMAALLFLPWVIDQLFPLWDDRNQTLHDKVSGTLVVRAK